MEKILIVEDDASNSQMMKEYLESHGYACTQAYSGSEGKLLFSMEEYDLVLLDLMLPGIPGEELVGLFSERAPVIVLSAKSGTDSKVEVLSAGAEDYLCKPFDLPELLVRIQVRLRRVREKGGMVSGEKDAVASGAASGAGAAGFGMASCARGGDREAGGEDSRPESGDFGSGKTYTYRDWRLSPDMQEMIACGEPVELTRHEFLILELLIRNPRRVFTKQMIYEYAWGEEYLAEDKTLNVHISNIRSKLKKSGTDNYIQTVWGIGFKLS